MANEAATGTKAKLGIGATDPVTTFFEFQNEFMSAEQDVWDGDGIRGYRDHDTERSREGLIKVGGSVTLYPGPAELAVLLPLILCGTPSGNNYPLGETVPEFFVIVDRVTKVHKYTGCKVAKATFKASQGGPLELTLEILGKTEVESNAGTFPAGSPPYEPPFMFHDLGVTFLAETRLVNDIEVVIDNRLNGDRFNQSKTRTDIPTEGRFIDLSVTAPYTAENSELHPGAINGSNLVATFTNGPDILTFTFGTVRFAIAGPTVKGRGEILVPLKGRARRASAGASPALAVTLVNG